MEFEKHPGNKPTNKSGLEVVFDLFKALSSILLLLIFGFQSVRVVVKEEEEMVDSSDIFAHISGVNSFKCSYPIQSWI